MMKFVRKILLATGLLYLLFLAACGAKDTTTANTSASRDVTVSAAVSLKDAFTEIGDLYRSKTKREVTFNFGASGALQKQIEGGAPVDVFASAGEKQMDELAAKNLIDPATRTDFARNRLVLVVPKDSKIRIAAFSDLARPEIGKISVGNPKTVPAGQYTEQLFAKLALAERLGPKLVLAEDVRQVLEYVARGEVDAGVVYATDARSSNAVRVAAAAPPESHDPILYPLAVINDAKNKAGAAEFATIVTGPEGRAILRKYGFETVER